MQTDVMLTNPSRRIVIETKYYATPYQAHHGTKKLRSEHLYQVLTYVEHLSAIAGPEPIGVLLYASAGEDWRLEYRLRGHRLLVRTLDLDRDWKAIHRDLLGMAEELAGIRDKLSA